MISVAVSLLSLLAVTSSLAQEASAPKKLGKAKPGLPGITPQKKAASAAKTSAAVPGGAPPSSTPFASYRLKLQGAYCPSAPDTDKSSLACKTYALTKEMRAASEEQKKSLMAQKMQLYRDANAKSETEKKAATVAAKTLYTKAYAKYCVGTKLTSDPVCTNDLMKKMYGHPGKKSREVIQRLL